MRKGFIVLTCVLAICCLALPALAGSYPEKPIQVIVPYKPGGGSDVSARIVAEHLKKYLPQPVVVTNISGSAGGMGAMAAMKSRPDGYTVFWEHPTMTMTPLVRKTKYSWKSFDPVCMVASAPMCLIVPKDSPWKTSQEAFAAIKAAPGKYRFPMAMAGVSQFVYLYIQDATGIEPLAIPTTGDKNRILSLLGGNGDITCVTFSAALPYAKSGDLRILGIVSDARSPFAPDVPTLKEQGVDAAYDFLYTAWLPKGSPKEAAETLKAAFQKVLGDQDCLSALAEQCIVPNYKDTPETIAIWEAQSRLNEEVAKRHNLLIQE
ncbi:MAG: tripartite tricarboxylate transporter substrate binding protein [Desulfovibrionaceae bacterium]|nr:tripartite tricarboxylate transporter substrate binding protein [Desulfovibrionaceae bacterium]